MNLKKYYPILVGIISLIIFGLILPQPIQAIFVLIDWPGSYFLKSVPVLLCILVGLVQGTCEELGYYYVFRYKFKNGKDWSIPILFGIGRCGLELFYNLVIIALGSYNISTLVILVIARALMFCGGIGLTIMDYVSARVTKTKTLCFLAIIFHAIMNGVLYAIEINYLQTIENFDNFFMIVMASIIILISSCIYKNNKVKSKV